MGTSASLAELERIYNNSLALFVRTAAAICGDRNLARDAVHDAFVSAVRSRDSFRGDGTVEAWIWQIVVRAASKQRAAAARDTPLDTTTELVGSNGEIPDLRSVRLAVAELPERQRLAIFLRYYADLDYQQIADILEITTGTVGATLNAAHASLRGRVGELMHDE